MQKQEHETLPDKRQDARFKLNFRFKKSFSVSTSQTLHGAHSNYQKVVNKIPCELGMMYFIG